MVTTVLLVSLPGSTSRRVTPSVDFISAVICSILARSQESDFLGGLYLRGDLLDLGQISAFTEIGYALDQFHHDSSYSLSALELSGKCTT